MGGFCFEIAQSSKKQGFYPLNLIERNGSILDFWAAGETPPGCLLQDRPAHGLSLRAFHFHPCREEGVNY
jgi:hypothetical protein